MSRRKHRTKLRAPQNQRQVTESTRGERAVIIGGYDAHDESESIMASLPGGTIAERLDSAKRGLFLDDPKPEPAQPHTGQLRCSCGYIARPELMDKHHQKYGMRGVHSDRQPYVLITEQP